MQIASPSVDDVADASLMIGFPNLMQKTPASVVLSGKGRPNARQEAKTIFDSSPKRKPVRNSSQWKPLMKGATGTSSHGSHALECNFKVTHTKTNKRRYGASVVLPGAKSIARSNDKQD